EQQWQAAALPGGQAAFLQQLFQWAPAAANAQVFTAPTRAHEEIHRLAQCRFELQASQTGGQAQWCEAVPLKLPVSRWFAQFNAVPKLGVALAAAVGVQPFAMTAQARAAPGQHRAGIGAAINQFRPYAVPDTGRWPR